MQTVPPIHLLQTLVTFADQENLVLTAERLGLTQPTVSRQLQQLEELFPQPLFTVQGRNKVLTDYGLALVSELRPRFTDFERIFQRVDQSFSNTKEITLRIGGRKEILDKYFAGLNFEGGLELFHLQEENLSSRIENLDLDFAVTSAEIDSDLWTGKKLFNEVPTLVIPKRWSNEVETAKDWSAEASKYPACAFSRDLPLLGDYLEKYKLEPHLNCLIEDWSSLEKRVHEQKSWSILPNSFIQESRGYKLIPLSGSGETQYLYYRKELQKHPWLKDLIDQIHK